MIWMFPPKGVSMPKSEQVTTDYRIITNSDEIARITREKPISHVYDGPENAQLFRFMLEHNGEYSIYHVDQRQVTVLEADISRAEALLVIALALLPHNPYLYKLLNNL